MTVGCKQIQSQHLNPPLLSRRNIPMHTLFLLLLHTHKTKHFTSMWEKKLIILTQVSEEVVEAFKNPSTLWFLTSTGVSAGHTPSLLNKSEVVKI